MAYYIDLFSPETYEAFANSDRSVSGFRERHKGIASDIKQGDKFICYVTKISRWFGVLEVQGNYFVDSKPIFFKNDDPFSIRFPVVSKVWLPLDQAVPISDDILWKSLSFTKHLAKDSVAWTGWVRGSLRRLDDSDGQYLESVLVKQSTGGNLFELSHDDKRKLARPTVRTQESKEVHVSIPENEKTIITTVPETTTSIRESIKIQALLAQIGERMDLRIWVPRNDKQKVLEMWAPKEGTLLEILPLNYDDATLRTIENIDVLWIRGRSIVRAFEVEHTTSIYSGILRMADLMALQPNLNIAAHIVAPSERKDKVLQEISRPVFAVLEKGPLAESCTFVSYDAVRELANEKRLEYMNDSILEEYAEYAEESGI
ncbi:MAG TPA: hypothetical protein VNX68_11585 [Nitrosopumilaceae archaeon]|nr:hypothetical protein [Nitrosopumilaceae archaeon]